MSGPGRGPLTPALKNGIKRSVGISDAATICRFTNPQGDNRDVESGGSMLARFI